MFWRKKDKLKESNEILDKLLPILKIARDEIENLKHRIELIEAKFRSKILKKNLESEVDETTENSIKDDGFNELRQLRKSGVI